MLISLIILFVAVFFSSFGVPGGMVTLISMGALSNNYTELLIVIVVGSIGAMLGDFIAYVIAEKFSARVNFWLNKFKFYRDNESKARKHLNKSEFLIVFITRWFFTGLGAPVSYISGFERLNKKKYMIAVIAGELLYGSVYPLMGFFFKETWNDLTSTINSTIIVLTLTLFVILIIYFIIKKIKSKRIKK